MSMRVKTAPSVRHSLRDVLLAGLDTEVVATRSQDPKEDPKEDPDEDPNEDPDDSAVIGGTGQMTAAETEKKVQRTSEAARAARAAREKEQNLAFLQAYLEERRAAEHAADRSGN